MANALDFASLQLNDKPRLETLSPAVARIIFSYFTSAKSVAAFGQTCRALQAQVRAHGWREFVKAQFPTLDIPRGVSDQEYYRLAKTLTFQSKAWDRRAFTVTSVTPPAQYAHDDNPRGGGRGRLQNQTFPAHAVVDAASQFKGNSEQETVAWGLGEDVMVRLRDLRHGSLHSEQWATLPGDLSGFKAGDDDTSTISIVQGPGMAPSVLIGRASGYLHLVSIDKTDFGRPIAWFQPDWNDPSATVQTSIQHFDVNSSQDTVAAISKDSLFFYKLQQTLPFKGQDNSSCDMLVHPTESIAVGDLPSSRDFRFLKEAKFLPNGDVALCMTNSAEALRYLTRTPAGSVMTNAAKLLPSSRCSSTYAFSSDEPMSARSILPVDSSSLAGGSSSTLLASFNDGTVRLQDLRTPSAVDTIYQDHLELTTAVGPLVSYGMERFIVGSARLPILKVFDFRWTKTYSYIDALDCAAEPMDPMPKSLTATELPSYTPRSPCCHMAGLLCSRHGLARNDFYRPNCNIYVPFYGRNDSPIYSLAKSSDRASSVYAGLTGQLLKLSLKDEVADERESAFMKHMNKANRFGYDFRQSLTSIVETGNGIALDDISDSKRLPVMFKQKEPIAKGPRNVHRLDDAYM